MDIEELLETLPIYDAGMLEDVDKALEILVNPTGGVGPPAHRGIEFAIFTCFVVYGPDAMDIDPRAGKYVHTLREFPYSDVVRNIASDAEITVMLGNDECDPTDLTVVTCLGQCTDKCIRFYLDLSRPPRSFYVKFRCYLFREDVRKSVLTAPEVFTRTHMYKDGFIVRDVFAESARPIEGARRGDPDSPSFCESRDAEANPPL